MAGELDGYDERARLRISDGDRHQVSELLRQAAGEGRLDLDELDERLEAAYAAKTYGDLVPLTVDLPAGLQDALPRAGVQPPVSRVPATRYDSSIAVLSGCTRRGAWEIGPEHTAVTLMGGVDLDLREARFAARETVIRAYTIMGGVEVLVNASTRVVVDGIGIMGAFEQARDRVVPELRPDSPIVRVTGFALMGGVTVSRRRMPGEARRRLIGR